MVSSLGRCNEEANIPLGPVLQVHSRPHTNMQELDFGELANCGPTYPFGFKDYIGGVGPFNWAQVQCVSNEYIGDKNSLEEGIEVDQSYEESFYSISNSIEKVPQTPMLESVSTLQREDNEVMVPDKVDLMDAQISWDIGKILGLQVSNKKAMIAMIDKVQEC